MMEQQTPVEKNPDHTVDEAAVPVTDMVSAPISGSEKKLSPLKIFGLSLVAVLVIALGSGIGAVVYAVQHHSEKPIVLTFAKMLHLSVASINAESVAYADYIEDVRTLKTFYRSDAAKSLPPVTDEQISDQVMSRLVINQLIQQIADTYKVRVTADDLTAARKKLLTPFPSEAEAEKQLQTTYGWSIDTYMNKIVGPVLLEQKLQQAVASSTDDIGKKYDTEEVQASHILFNVTSTKDEAKIKIKAEAVLKRAKAGEDFATLAKQFGSDATKDTGGDLGWFGHNMMVPEFETAAFALQPGQISPTLVKTQFGFHLIKLTGRRHTRNFVAFMDDQLASATIRILVSDIHNPFEKIKPVDEGIDMDNLNADAGSEEPMVVSSSVKN